MTMKQVEELVSTPRPVEGRRHQVMMTEEYVEILQQVEDKRNVDCQTDYLLNKARKTNFQI